LSAGRVAEYAHVVGQGAALAHAPIPHSHAHAGLDGFLIECRVVLWTLVDGRVAQGHLQAGGIRRVADD